VFKLISASALALISGGILSGVGGRSLNIKVTAPQTAKKGASGPINVNRYSLFLS
jgi:predicted secreted protein